MTDFDIDLTPLTIPLSCREEVHLVRLATDRPTRTLRRNDAGIISQAMGRLVAKGFADPIAEGWKLTEAGRTRCTTIY